jgi:hypothetical protein
MEEQIILEDMKEKPKKSLGRKLKGAIALIATGAVLASAYCWDPFSNPDYKTKTPIEVGDSKVIFEETWYSGKLNNILTIKEQPTKDYPNGSYKIISNWGRANSSIGKVVIKDSKGKTLEVLSSNGTDMKAMKTYKDVYDKALKGLFGYNSERKYTDAINTLAQLTKSGK